VLEGGSAAIRAFSRTLREAARHDGPVLLVGESGSGKSTFARALHEMSPRAARPFVRIDCPAGPRDVSVRADAAATGTLFLDEIAELSTAAQAITLKLLEEAGLSAPPSFRMVASTRRDLDSLTRNGECPGPELSPALERALVAYSWPGNITELTSVLERMVVLTGGRLLDVSALPERMTS
jgi:DNA-binding NtrC family response regulator